MSVNPRINITTINSIDTKTACFNRARYYDPSLERFLGEDPIGFSSGDFNFYRYVGNDPVLFYDPYGKCPLVLGGLGVGAIVGMIDALLNAKCFDDALERLWTNIGAGGLAGIAGCVGGWGGAILGEILGLGNSAMSGVAGIPTKDPCKDEPECNEK